MKITLLCENTTGYIGARSCLSEWGLSAFIQINNTNILFDTGHTDVYLKNAKGLGINLEDTHYIILSHYHWDHTGGLRFHNFRSRKKLVAHPEVFRKLPPDQSKKILADFEIMSSKEPLVIAEDIIFLGEIPRDNDFEQGGFKGDRMADDSAIAVKTSNGAVVIAGCSHSGICNICGYAKTVTGQNLFAVIGGFHLFEENQKAVDQTINYFKSENPRYILPMHCVDFPTLVKFHTHFGSKKYSTGDIIEIDTGNQK